MNTQICQCHKQLEQRALGAGIKQTLDWGEGRNREPRTVPEVGPGGSEAEKSAMRGRTQAYSPRQDQELVICINRDGAGGSRWGHWGADRGQERLRARELRDRTCGPWGKQ